LKLFWKVFSQIQVEWWGDKFSVTAKFGGAGSQPGDTLELIVARAERSLLESKAARENGVTAVTLP
jgi:hypothetical protein